MMGGLICSPFRRRREKQALLAFLHEWGDVVVPFECVGDGCAQELKVLYHRNG